MARFFITLLMMVFVSSDAMIATTQAFAQGRSVQVGTTINRGHRIGCSQGSRLLRMRGFHTVRTLDLSWQPLPLSGDPAGAKL